MFFCYYLSYALSKNEKKDFNQNVWYIYVFQIYKIDILILVSFNIMKSGNILLDQTLELSKY